MEPIRVGTHMSMDKIEEIIKMYPLNKKVDIDRESYDDRLIYSFSLRKKKSYDEISLYNSISSLILDIMLKIYAKDLITIRVNKLLKDLSKDRKDEIIEGAYLLLMDKDFVRWKRVLSIMKSWSILLKIIH